LVETRQLPTHYFKLAVTELAKSKSSGKSVGHSPQFREDRRRTISTIQVKWVEALKGLGMGVAVAAAHAESPEAAAAIAKSAARHALLPLDPPERARFLGTVYEATFDTPKRHELVARVFKDAFATATDLPQITDEDRALLDFARLAAFEVIFAAVAKHVADSAAVAKSPKAAAAFAKDVVTGLVKFTVKQFPSNTDLFDFMDVALDKAVAAAWAENCRPQARDAIYSTKVAVQEIMLEVFKKSWDSASRDVAPPVAPT
jgi:hypothetical protein